MRDTAVARAFREAEERAEERAWKEMCLACAYCGTEFLPGRIYRALGHPACESCLPRAAKYSPVIFYSGGAYSNLRNS